ncbi:hypothetical protein [Pseudalkalibacillus sp. SCS-8]|uniref:hypothetical protein n=1 Tax=Pseudalkalibacillus nanhaiensis TaxID=3115291 RepID=UPI0032DB6EA8
MLETAYEMFQFVLTVGMSIIIPVIIIYKIIRKKKLPNNEFTPYDDLTMGRVPYEKQKISEDHKHHVQYEEKRHEN